MNCVFPAVSYPGLSSMDGFLVHSRLPSAFLSGCPTSWLVSIYTPGWREELSVWREVPLRTKCFTQEHNTVNLARARTRISRSVFQCDPPPPPPLYTGICQWLIPFDCRLTGMPLKATYIFHCLCSLQEICLMDCPCPFCFIFASKSKYLTLIPTVEFCSIKAGPIYIALMNAVISFSGSFPFISFD